VLVPGAGMVEVVLAWPGDDRSALKTRAVGMMVEAEAMPELVAVGALAVYPPGRDHYPGRQDQRHCNSYR